MITTCELNAVSKSFGQRPIIRDFSITVGAGEMVAVRGNSGTGKSTLLNIMGLLEDPDAGEVRLFAGPLREPGRRQLRSCCGTVSHICSRTTH